MTGALVDIDEKVRSFFIEVEGGKEGRRDD